MQPTRRYPFMYFPTLVLALFWLAAVAWLTRRWVMDDAYIGFHYLDNFLAGRGLTFNPGERIEGITNIGWIMLLAPFAYFFKVTTAAKVLGLALAALTVLLTADLAR